MSATNLHFDNLRGLTIGTVEFVSPREIKILLELNSPQNTALNTGEPTLFPKINGYVLMPNEAGALVGIISWIGIEHSTYPKRMGLKDFDLIDLPFPLRKMSVNPVGTIKRDKNGFSLERGVYSYPSVGDTAVIPSTEQLRSIVENKSPNARVKIGNSPFAANAPVYVDPDKLFGRHVAVLGNTGSGKSCSVAGLVRWCMEAAKEESVTKSERLNARFIILDPNGEYTTIFDDIAKVRKFKVSIEDEKDEAQQLRVPAWMWNSYEWSSISLASGRTQRPLLRRALRELRGGDYGSETNTDFDIRIFLTSLLITVKNKLKSGPSAYAEFPGKQNCGELFKSSKESLESFLDSVEAVKKTAIEEIITQFDTVLSSHPPSASGYYPAFNKPDLDKIFEKINEKAELFGGLEAYEGPDEDTPVPFNCNDLPNHLERLAQEQNVQQYLDFLIMRLRTMLSDPRMSSIIGSEEPITLVQWLEEYIGKNSAENGEIVIIDLSIVPSDILFTVVAVISRIIFEAMQRIRRHNNSLLPTVLVMEEAHNFISRYRKEDDEITSARLCSQTFEKIAKEGRKFGLGLMLSSQRPSELSSTVLSQCNTFLLHRIVNDKDQELVKKLVPDNLGTILNELPVLPSKKAILLGWAAPVPVLVDMNELREDHRPNAEDPEFWDVWTGKKTSNVNWNEIAAEWQKIDLEDKE